MTLIELMVAALVLVVGMLATVGVLTTAMKKTSLNAQRVTATNLARELTEAARVAGYIELSPAALVLAIQGGGADLARERPGLWSADRRGTW